MSEPEFSIVIRFDAIGRMQWPAHVEADAPARERLAARFGFAALEKLEADYSLTRDGSTLVASGTIHARLAQPCIATGKPVAETVNEAFAIRFVPEGSLASPDSADEIELDAEECDTLPYSGERIDIGEAIAETLALAVNPYPRSPNADTYLREAGVLTEEQASPFAALAALKEKGAKK